MIQLYDINEDTNWKLHYGGSQNHKTSM